MSKGSYLGGSTLIGPRSTGWFGTGSPTMQPATKKSKSGTSKPKSKKPSHQQSRKGNGLTIPEQVANARNRVETVRADIVKARKRLADLERQLAEAERQFEATKTLPRRSPIGKATAEAVEAKA